MGICWGAPDYPSPSFNGYLKPGLASLSFSSTSSSENGLSTSLGGRPTEVVPDVEVVPPPNVRVFTYKELQKATRNFKPDSNIGEGAFGVVYKGFLDEGFHGAIAVKKLNAESVQGFKEWKSEINFLGTLSHPNIVKLLGYCSEDGHLLLVYEYMSKGTLKNHLFRRASTETLPWTLRIQIATGAARGLAFLHQLDRQIICRDFKPSNILLDGDLNARISDFGLARAGPSDDRSHVSTQVVGTYGYAAPEYIATGRLYVKSDVYSFGVVLLEVLTGRRAYDENRPSGEHFVVEWVRPHVSKRKLARVVDPRLEGEYPLKDALVLAQLAYHCLQMEPKSRPSMAEVLSTLEEIATH
ncbi:hypothetical protein SAY86_005866 [Trapa natans]|uniref:Protein kinase domain-containing protein n=1 Tax=Trapa natans TaxID=22666 RepID=A0AAN7KVP5_TRANT|nr:hypothetical protein SAY86_005866 [Trapa natans]